MTAISLFIGGFILAWLVILAAFIWLIWLLAGFIGRL